MKHPETFAEIADSSRYRWPKTGDRLLLPSSDWDKAVEFTTQPTSRYVHIWSGFTSAGEALVEECNRHSNERHFLVYPIFFNYRHGLELAMKWIVDCYGRYADVSLTDEKRNHDLWALWKLCKKVIIAVGSEGESNEALRAVEQIVKDFHELDKSNMSFRYSANKTGEMFKLPDGSIDLDNVRNVMEAVDNFFNGVDGQLDANTSASDWCPLNSGLGV